MQAVDLGRDPRKDQERNRYWARDGKKVNAGSITQQGRTVGGQDSVLLGAWEGL